MPAAIVPLILALAGPSASAPAIILTPAGEAPAAVLSTRCAPTSPSAGPNDVECVVQEARRAGPATVRRISIQTPRATPCAALAAKSVAMPAAEGRPPPGALPLVVQEPRPPRCDR